MAVLLTLQGATKSFGVRPLFENISFVVESGDRIGLIGPNGAGKSTLLRVLASTQSLDEGSLSSQRGLKIGFLEQTPLLPLSKTVKDAVLERTLDPDTALAKTGEVLSRFELNAVAGSLIGELSGGWRKRVALAREWVKDPDLLLLDEPTNHLDIESILWLEDFLKAAQIATLTVTHDRVFLQRTTNRVLDLDPRNPGGLFSIRGDYRTFLEKKQELLDSQERRETILRNTLRRETEWLRQGAKARTTKQQARIQAAENLQEQVEELKTRNQKQTARLEFQSSEKKPKRLLEARKISKTLGGRLLFRDLDLFIGPGSRVALLGKNGTGKSTLIRVLLGQEPPDSGDLLRSEHLKVAYFEQNREVLDPELSLRRTLCPSGDHVEFRGRKLHLNSYLERFLFRKEQAEMPLGKLSGGEQSRVLLARLMLKEANVLILDEPTNDLDVETLDVLQDCLTDFDGAVVLVTHDRYFLDQVANEVYAFSQENQGQVICFAGLAQWEKWQKQQKAPVSKATPASEPSREVAKKRKLSFHEVRELEGIEKVIQAEEQRLLEFQTQAEAAENQSNASLLSELFQSIANSQTEIERLYSRWAELDALNKR